MRPLRIPRLETPPPPRVHACAAGCGRRVPLEAVRCAPCVRDGRELLARYRDPEAGGRRD